MKVKMHVRVADTPRGPKVQANRKVSYDPLYDSNGRAYPTVAFALVLDVDDKAFTRAREVVARLDIPAADTQVAAEVVGAA